MFANIIKFFSHLKVQIALIVLIIIIPIIYLCFGVPHIDFNLAKDIIITLIQIEATLVAIIITVSLVTVQLNASAYSNRVIDIFQESLKFWSIIICYIFSIVLGLLILILGIDKNWLTDLSVFAEFYISIIVFLLLIPYIFINFNLVKPINIIENLAIKVTKDRIISSISSKDDEDPLQPIIDILQISLSKYDHKTLENGLNSINKHLKGILDEENLDDEERKKIQFFLTKHFRRVGTLAIKNNDDDALIKLITFILDNSVNHDRWTYDNEILLDIISFLKEVGNGSIDKKMSNSIIKITISLAEIGKIAAANGNLDIIRDIRIFHDKLINSLINLDVNANTYFNSICEFSKKVCESLLDKTIEDEYSSVEWILILYNFYVILEKLVNKEDDSSAAYIITEIYELIELSIIHNSIAEIKYSINLLVEIRKMAIIHKLNITSSLCGLYIAKTFIGGIVYENDSTINESWMALEKIANKAKDEDFIPKKGLIKAFEWILAYMQSLSDTNSELIEFNEKIQSYIDNLNDDDD